MCDLADNLMKHKWKGHQGGAHWWDQSYCCPKCYNQERLCNAEEFKQISYFEGNLEKHYYDAAATPKMVKVRDRFYKCEVCYLMCDLAKTLKKQKWEGQGGAKHRDQSHSCEQCWVLHRIGVYSSLHRV